MLSMPAALTAPAPTSSDPVALNVSTVVDDGVHCAAPARASNADPGENPSHHPEAHEV
ncbi:Hypothetical protein CAP_8250 [Chondromyces apiculatus DSM 436]|uniref:Uncharacterized protein n=2 Tax=Chondromyces apiculatus TaxID=51 RepID=A0A017TES6_9BACT|nr:Hypothetical protein CAP_8250 [Chondromyces apiculatus DSM 436]